MDSIAALLVSPVASNSQIILGRNQKYEGMLQEG